MSGPYYMTWSSREYAQRKVVDLSEYRSLRLADEIYALDLEDWLASAEDCGEDPQDGAA